MIELQRLRQPVAHALRERLRDSRNGPHRRRLYQIDEPFGVILRRQRTANDQRQGNSSHLRDISSRVEDRRSDRAWQCDGQLAPISGPRMAQLLECGAEHVFDNRQTAGRREDEPLGGDGAIADVGRGSMQRRGGRDQLTYQGANRVELGRNSALLRVSEQR